MPGFRINGQGDGPSAVVESSRLHRWVVRFFDVGGVNLDSVSLYAKEIDRPKVEDDVLTMHHSQNLIYLPAKHKWTPINAVFCDIADSSDQSNLSTSRDLFDYWRSVINLNSNTINSDFRGKCIVSMLDGLNTETVLYELFDVWPSKIEPAKLDYTSSDISTVAVTLQYNSAVVISNI